MPCNAQDLVHAYLDGELDVVRTIDMDRHVAECPTCTDTVARQRALRGLLAAPGMRFAPTPELTARIRGALAAVDDGARTRRTAASARPWRWAFSGAALALTGALLVIRVLVPGTSARDRLADEMLASHVRSLMVTHLTDVASSDRHTVRPWFDGKLDYSPAVKDLAAAGFPLVGGRLDYLSGRAVAALVYARQKHLINVFVWPASADDVAPASLARNGYNVVGWKADGMVYWAVSDLNAEELQEFERLVRE